MSNSSKPCPRCRGVDRPLLRWSENERPPEVAFDRSTGRIQSVSLMRYCIQCGYKETGFLSIQQEPKWSELKEEAE